MAPALEELNLSQAIQSTRLAETNIRVTPVFLPVSIWNHTCKWPIMSHNWNRTRLMMPILPAHFWFVCSNIAWHQEHIMKCSCWHGLLPGHLSSLACRNSHLILTFLDPADLYQKTCKPVVECGVLTWALHLWCLGQKSICCGILLEKILT